MGQGVTAASGSALVTLRGVKYTLLECSGRITQPWSPKWRALASTPSYEAVTMRSS